MPKISIILPSYNHAKFICESIESALNQTYTDFELIIWDDASSDNSWELIQKYSDPRIKAYRNEENYGGVFGVNKAISEVAQGEYIAIHHSDDVWLLNKLEKQAAVLDTEPNIDACFSFAGLIDKYGRRVGAKQSHYKSIFYQDNRSKEEWFKRLLSVGNCLCHPSVLIRKSSYFNFGLYNPLLKQLTDYDFWLRLTAHRDIRVLQEELVYYRVDKKINSQSAATFDNDVRMHNELFLVLNSAISKITPEILCDLVGQDKNNFAFDDDLFFQFYLEMYKNSDCNQLKIILLSKMYDLFSVRANEELFAERFGMSHSDFSILHSSDDLTLRPTVDRKISNNKLSKIMRLVFWRE